METELKVSVKTMKEIIRSAGLATADLFDRADIEARYAEALTRLDEAERLKSQPKKRRHIAEESSDDDDDGPMIPEPTGVEKSKVANKFSAYAHVDDEEPTGWLKSGSARHKEPAQELRHRAAQMQPYKAALVKTTGAGEQMQIFVKPYYRTLTLDVRPSDTVAVVKSMIQYRTEALEGVEEAYPSYKMSLSYAGKPLARDDRTLADYGVGNLARLTFGINMSGKRPPTQGPHLLCLQYPTERKAFSSDCFYKVRPADTIGDLKLMVLAREGIVCTCLRLGYQDWVYRDGEKLSRILGDSEALPTLRVIHYSRRARASRTVTRLATDLVREVLSYSDLRTLAAGAATCRALLEAVPPKLAHELVLRKFPILSTIVDAAKPMPPARELFESQALLFGAPPPTVAPSRGLDEYVLSLELTVDDSKHVGTGVVQDNATEAQIRFTGIPKALWDEAVTIEENITANIMATRRGTLRRAALYSGDVEDIIPPAICFEWNRIPCENVAMGWISAGGGPHNVYYKPLICVEWNAPAAAAAETELTATFKWDSDDQTDDMNLEDACLMLEHWCKL